MSERKAIHDLAIHEFKAALLRLRDELEAVAFSDAGSAAVVELDQSRVGRLSRMDAMQAQAMAQASLQRHRLGLRKVSAALQRIEDGVYGNCLDCDRPIDPRRLEIDPTASLCIECANRSER